MEVEKLIRFIEGEEDALENMDELRNKSYRMILGERPYIDMQNNVKAHFTRVYKFSEVAFLSSEYKFTMFIILSIIMQSHDKAAELINEILVKQRIKINQLADFLFKYGHIIMVNRMLNTGSICSKNKEIINMLEKHKVNKVLIIGKSDNTISKKLLKYFDCKNIKYEIVPHTSPKVYSGDKSRWCELYLQLNDNTLKNLKFNDFAL